MELAGGVRVELIGGFLLFFLWLLLVPAMRLLMQIVVFWGLCSINVWTSVYGGHLHLQHQQFLAIVLPLLLHYLLHCILVQPSELVFFSDGHHL